MSREVLTSEQMILPNSPAAARYRTDIKGWVSRDGHYCGDGPQGERAARYSGSTHSLCQRCGNPCEKSWLACDECRIVLDHERWEKLELVEWDGETPLTLHRGDEYFFDADSVYDYAETYDLTVSDLDLVVCVPNNARLVDAEYWTDELPEGGDLPAWLAEAVDTLNKVIDSNKDKPLSWSAGRKRVVLPEREVSDDE